MVCQLADAVLAMIHQRHAAAFTSSAQFMRLLKVGPPGMVSWPALLSSDAWLPPLCVRQFKFLETRPAKESDFHMLRILGRGGFGAVKGVCR